MRIVAKTEQTLKLERKIYNATQKQGVFGCFEVTIGYFGKERVDYLTYDTNGIWRCYEIKVSKSDFRSKAHNTFIGHYNYYVMPSELYEEVKDEVPPHIGVYLGSGCEKRSKKQSLQVDETILFQSMVRSLSREFNFHFKSEDESRMRRYQCQIKDLERTKQDYHKRWLELYNGLTREERKRIFGDE